MVTAPVWFVLGQWSLLLYLYVYTWQKWLLSIGPYMEMIVQELILYILPLENTHDVKKMGIQWSLNLNKGHIGNNINSAALSLIERLSSFRGSKRT